MLKLVLLDGSTNGLLPRICSIEQLRFRRRTLTPPPWVPAKQRSFIKALTPEEKADFEIEFSDKFTSDVWAPMDIESTPVSNEKREWTINSKRFGLVARKIGMQVMWFKDGSRTLATLLEIPENHVISAVDPDTWFKRSLVGKQKAFNRFGEMWRIMIGAIDTNPTFLTPPYRRMFEKINVPYKDRVIGFMATEDAVVPPGTVLDARHFQIGQFVAVTGKTIDWGFQGGMHRWGMRGMPRLWTTKSHRRIGSVGSTGDACIVPGKRMPGHMGYEWRTTFGLEVLRINPVKQVIYVKGSTPGDIGEILLIKDCLSGKKTVKDPPFPTFVPTEEDVLPNRGDVSIADITRHDIYGENVFQFTSPSIVFTEKDETRAPARDKSRAKTAKLDVMNQRPVGAARLPTTILLPVFKNLSLKDINACMRVCRHWNAVIESSGRQLWLPLAKKEVPESGLNDGELFNKSMAYKNRLRAFRFAFNPQDASRNTFIRTNGFTVHRQPIAQSTDAIRGKIGVSSGVHSYQITWKGPLGTVAVVGLATKHAALHCPGYVALLGSDDQSWGFNLVDNSLLHNGALIGAYPRINNPPKYQVGDKLTMVLNKDQNILYFEKNGEFLGVAFDNLPPVKLFPAICAVYGNTEVSLVYTGQPLSG